MEVCETARLILVEAIADLPDELKTVFGLKYGDEYLTNREIAAVLNVSEREVEVLLTRAYDYLRPPLQSYDPTFAAQAPLRVKGSRAVH